jgi:hypothetical protein
VVLVAFGAYWRGSTCSPVTRPRASSSVDKTPCHGGAFFLLPTSVVQFGLAFMGSESSWDVKSARPGKLLQETGICTNYGPLASQQMFFCLDAEGQVAQGRVDVSLSY